MATVGNYFYIEPNNIELELNYNGKNTVSSDWIYLNTDIFPSYFEGLNFSIIADKYTSGDCVVTVSTTANGVDEDQEVTESYVSVVRDSIIERFKVSVRGVNNNDSGYLYLNYISEQIYIEYDSSKLPIIKILDVSRTKISSIQGFDQCIVTFYSDLTVETWEARATIQNQSSGHGIGLLVESGASRLYAGVIAKAYIEDEELTNGDRDYTISIFGQLSDGRWSSG